MIVRPFKMEDWPVLKDIYDHSGYDFPFPDNLEDYFVVVDDTDTPIMGAGAKLVPEVTLLCAPFGATHPLVKVKGIALLHDVLRDTLMAKGHKEAICSVPPKLEANYGRHLQRHFHWKESWKTFRIRDWRR